MIRPDSTAHPHPAAAPRNSEGIRRRRRLFGLGVAGTAAVMAFYAYGAEVRDPLHILLGEAIILLSLLPALLWARRASFSLPLFETFMITGLNTYAIPLLGGHQALGQFEARHITTAAVGVIMFQVAALVAFSLVQARPQRTRFWTEEIVGKNVPRYLGYGMFVTTAYTVVAGFTDWIPRDLIGAIRAVAYGIGIIATFIQCRRWGLGELRPREKSTFLFLFVVQIVLSWAALFLIGGISIIVLGLLGYVSGGKKFPLLAVAIVVPIVAVLHNGKSTMRAKYWENREATPAISGLPFFFAEWIGYGLDPSIQAARKDSNRLLERTSLFHIMCLVVSVTPERLPYLDGETYAQVPGQFVPRFFWPDKPGGHISTNTLSIYYGLQRAEDTAKTTIGFGLLTEAYANFGFYGLGIVGAFFGVFFKLASVWATRSPVLSYGGLFVVILMAWSFQTELAMSIWLSSLFQACVAVLGLVFVTRNFLK